MLWRFCINLTDCLGITGYSPETILIVYLKKNLVFTKLSETSFGSSILASFTECQYQGIDTFGFIRMQALEIHIQGNFLHKSCIDTFFKSWKAVFFVISEINSSQ